MKKETVCDRPDFSDRKNLSVYRAIRFFCLDCTCGQSHVIESCPDCGCPLWRFRFGKNPTVAEREGKDVRSLRGGTPPKLSPNDRGVTEIAPETTNRVKGIGRYTFEYIGSK
jgi:hypothetical protein